MLKRERRGREVEGRRWEKGVWIGGSEISARQGPYILVLATQAMTAFVGSCPKIERLYGSVDGGKDHGVIAVCMTSTLT